MTRRISFVLFVLLALLVAGAVFDAAAPVVAKKKAPPPPPDPPPDPGCEVTYTAYDRWIEFSGYVWSVKDHGKRKVGPGPNLFSDSTANVWVDGLGRLHLRLTRSGRRWYAAEVINRCSFGYGTYRFYLDSEVADLDPNVVLGLFTWSDDPAFDHRELDVEFARWGNPADVTNAQYVKQPYDVAGNLVRFLYPSFFPQGVHSFLWADSSVHFESYTSHSQDPGDLVMSHIFTSEIPLPGDENPRINLWLFRGSPPADGQEVEVIISRFEFEPGSP